MSLILDTLEKKPKEAKRLLGISYEQFNQLVYLIKQLHEHQIQLREKKLGLIVKEEETSQNYLLKTKYY